MNHLMKDHLLSTHTVPHISHTHLSYAAYFAFLQKILKENPHTHTLQSVTLQQRAASLTLLEIETLI